jgi:hypothetical protein
VHGKTKPKGLVSSRDMILFSAYLDLGNDTYAMVSHSVESDIPVPADHVRCDMKLAINLFQPAAGDANRCHH